MGKQLTFRICEILDAAQEGTSFLNGHLASEACLSRAPGIIHSKFIISADFFLGARAPASKRVVQVKGGPLSL